MRDIVKTEGLNFHLNEIVDHYVDEELDKIIEIVEDWKTLGLEITTDSVIGLLKSHKPKK